MRTGPRYLYARLSQSIWQKFHPDAPWLVRSALGPIAARLSPTARGAEWGSGRSTVWFARQVEHVTSVEDDPDWYAVVLDMLDKRGLSGRVSLCKVDAHGTTEDYLAPVAALAADSLDFVLVDGSRDRGRCLEIAMAQLKSGGLLILDNAERYCDHPSLHHLHNHMDAIEIGDPVWARLRPVLATWNAAWFNDGVSATALFTKPHRH